MDRLAYTLEDQRRMSMAKNYFAWQSRLVLPELGRRVVEIGCGIGNFTGQLLDRDLVVAVDREPECIAALKLRYPGYPNLHALARDVTGDEGLDGLSAYRPDSCVCLNVLEHIEDDAGLVRRMADILTPGGVIVLLVPAFPALYGPIDRNLGHFRRYTRRSVARLAAETGLQLKKSHYVNLPGFFGWWMNARVLRREEQSAGQIGIFDKYLVPVVSRLETLAHPPLGQSLFVVLRKAKLP